MSRPRSSLGWMTTVLLAAVTWTALTARAAVAEPEAPHTLTLLTRSRAEDPDQPGRYKFVYKTVELDAKKTAIIICDMWNQHWCKGATRRVGEMAPRMNEVVKEARRRGVFIIHAPSGTMDYYKDTPQRKLAQAAPKAEAKVSLRGWCPLDPKREGPLPIDDSDGGCDCQPPCPQGHPWTHQIDAIGIAEGDAITDNEEAYYLLQDRGIDNVILMGVHVNMCVLGRPFGIRKMVDLGKNVLLMRDMTDSMYNSRKEPHVSHVRGTELVIEHIEKHWCPTVTSSDVIGGPAFRFSEDDRPHVVFIVSDDHYQADKTLPVFAQMLRERYGLNCTVLHGEGKPDIPNTDELKAADCTVLFIRRLALPKAQLDAIRKYLDGGGPLVGMRTASHAFDVHGNAEEGRAEWPEFDAQVLGGNYHGHEANAAGTDVAIVPEQAGHPVVAGVEPARWHSVGSRYNNAPLGPDATMLMTGSLEGQAEPLTWVRTYHGGRVVYIGLGHPDDFPEPPFRQLLINAIHWAMDRPVKEVK